MNCSIFTSSSWDGDLQRVYKEEHIRLLTAFLPPVHVWYSATPPLTEGITDGDYDKNSSLWYSIVVIASILFYLLLRLYSHYQCNTVILLHNN